MAYLYGWRDGHLLTVEMPAAPSLKLGQGVHLLLFWWINLRYTLTLKLRLWTHFHSLLLSSLTMLWLSYQKQKLNWLQRVGWQQVPTYSVLLRNLRIIFKVPFRQRRPIDDVIKETEKTGDVSTGGLGRFCGRLSVIWILKVFRLALIMTITKLPPSPRFIIMR